MIGRKVGLVLGMVMIIISTPKEIYAANCIDIVGVNGSICTNNRIYTCLTGGNWDSGSECGGTCSYDKDLKKASCVQDTKIICKSGSQQRYVGGKICGNNKRSTCLSNGTWSLPGEPCPSGTNCVNDDVNGTASCVTSTTNPGGTTYTGSSYNPFNGCSTTSINTALGCVPVEMNKFVPWLLSWLFGVAGGIAFLLMSYGFILIATSAGDEKKVQGARETITSAVIGLLVCIFAIFILRLVAVNILQIPGIN
jgi:hypothetical protein